MTVIYTTDEYWATPPNQKDVNVFIYTYENTQLLLYESLKERGDILRVFAAVRKGI